MATAPKPITLAEHPIAPETSMGHVHLKVADLNRATEFYRNVLGFDVMQRYGDPRSGLLRVMNGRSRQ
jgi:catechol 2,3-dioxygenase